MSKGDNNAVWFHSICVYKIIDNESTIYVMNNWEHIFVAFSYYERGRIFLKTTVLSLDLYCDIEKSLNTTQLDITRSTEEKVEMKQMLDSSKLKEMRNKQ